MTSTPSEPRLYDVWLMWVEFPDHPGIGKPRPVVITEVDGDLYDVDDIGSDVFAASRQDGTELSSKESK